MANMATDQQPLLYIKNLWKSFPIAGTDRINIVLSDINLLIYPGQFVTLVGPSGCGKTTLLRLILGSEVPTSGILFLNRNVLEGYQYDRDRGIVFQRYSLFPHMTAVENVAAGLMWERTNLLQNVLTTPKFRRVRRQSKEEAKALLEHVGLGEHLDKYPEELSGGQRQRVAIAQSAIMKPKILLMDEPFGALDDKTRQEMQLTILNIWQEAKMTIIFVTHDLEEAVYLGQRVVVLSQYYSSSDPKDEVGAKIVDDLAVPGEHPKPMSFKYTPEFNRILATIRRDGLDPNTKQRIEDFNLQFPNTFTGWGG